MRKPALQLPRLSVFKTSRAMKTNRRVKKGRNTFLLANSLKSVVFQHFDVKS